MNIGNINSKDLAICQTNTINEAYEYAVKNGALGGKLIGAGGRLFIILH